jgi:hypothetical protein
MIILTEQEHSKLVDEYYELDRLLSTHGIPEDVHQNILNTMDKIEKILEENANPKHVLKLHPQNKKLKGIKKYDGKSKTPGLQRIQWRNCCNN